jgi:putative glutamine amidotransferase
MTPVVGIPACARTHKGIDILWHETPARYAEALFHASGVLPVMIPPLGPTQTELLDRLDGLLLPGSPSNVHPSLYEGGDSLTPDCHDHERDATTMPLVRKAIARGIPVLAICRGIQELNVALGGTLHQTVHNVSGRLDHRAGFGAMEEKYGLKHTVKLSGRLAHLIGVTEIMVNSLHGQAIDQPAPGMEVEALAPDGTIEAVWVASAPGFTLGIQWHPEWRYAENPGSMAIFKAFGDACRTAKSTLKKAA